MVQDRNTTARASNAAKTSQDGLLERPLTPRSIVASLLLGMHPPRLTSARLVRWCSLFGVSDNATRVALSRMVERGELGATDGIYELAGPIRRRQAPQDWVLAPELAAWDGRWWLAVVDAGRRPAAKRVALRAAARTIRFVELREGVWTRPANVPRASAPAEAWDLVEAQSTRWDAHPPGDQARLADDLFDAARWAGRARGLRERLEPVTTAIARGEHGRLADGFVVGAATLQHLRHDPFLPRELLAAPWPADSLRRAYLSYRDIFGPAVAAFLR